VKDKCQGIHYLLGAWLDGELPKRKAGRIAEHLESCPVCRAEVDRIRAVRNLLREGFSAAVAVEDGALSSLHERIMRQIPFVKGGDTRGPERTRFWTPILRFRPVTLTLTVTVLLVSAVFFVVYKPAPTVIKTSSVNDCIVEDVESGDRTILLFKTHGSDMTVIWVTGNRDV